MDLQSHLKEFRYRQINDTYVVWLASMNRYLQLKEPAFGILQSFAEGAKPQETALELSRKYQLPEKTAYTLTRNVTQTLAELVSSYQEKMNPRLPQHTLPGVFEVYSEKFITIYDKVFRFTFASEALEQFIYPVLSHLECPVPPPAWDVHFEVFKFGEKISLRLNKEQNYAWPMDQAYKLKGGLFLQLINTLYHMRDESWMGVIHASSVSLGKSALIFPAQAGGGKSTLASLMMAHGCKLISDDFTPISAKDSLLYTFPGRISLKPGSLPLLSSYFPELKDVPDHHFPYAENSMKFLSPVLAENSETTGFSAKAIVFVQYDQDVECEVERLKPLDAINRFLTESWLSSTPQSAACFLDWYFTIPCISLRYRDHNKAVAQLIRLLSDDT